MEEWLIFVRGSRLAFRYGSPFLLWNLTNGKELVAGGASGEGIKLGWRDRSSWVPPNGEFEFRASDQGADPVLYGRDIGLWSQAGWLIHQRQNRTVSLAWSQTPSFEWQLRGMPDGAPFLSDTPFGLFNTKANDLLVVGARPCGIHLKFAGEVVPPPPAVVRKPPKVKFNVGR